MFKMLKSNIPFQKVNSFDPILCDACNLYPASYLTEDLGHEPMKICDACKAEYEQIIDSEVNRHKDPHSMSLMVGGIKQ